MGTPQSAWISCIGGWYQDFGYYLLLWAEDDYRQSSVPLRDAFSCG